MRRLLTKNIIEVKRSVIIIIIFFLLGAILFCIKVNFVCMETNFWPLEPTEIYNKGRNGKNFFVLRLLAFWAVF